MVVLIDNYDSFSYSLYQLAGTICPDIAIYRNDALTVEQLDALSPDAIILSSGPGRPEEAGICIETVRRLGHKYPIRALQRRSVICARRVINAGGTATQFALGFFPRAF